MTWSPSLDRHLHADDDGFLADIEVAEAADQPHAVKLAGLLLEAADQQHLAIGVQLLLGREAWRAAMLQHHRRWQCLGRHDGRLVGRHFLGPVGGRDQELRSSHCLAGR